MLTTIVAIALGGCWDYMDVENRAFIVGVGVDSDGEGGYIVTTEIAHPQGQPQSGGEGGNLPEPPKLLKERQGPTLGAALYHLGDGHLSRVPLWQEVNSLLISDEVARDGIAPVVDLFLRSTILNIRARVFIVEGSTADVLAWVPEFQPLTSRYLRDMERQFSLNPLYARPRNVIAIASKQQEIDGVLLPRIVMEGDEVRAKGSGVIQNGVLVGWLDEETTVGANWLLGDLNRTMAQIPCPGTPNGKVTLELNALGNKISVEVDESGLKTRYEIQAHVRILDMARCPLDPLMSTDREQLEQQAVVWMRERTALAVTRAQEELRVDFLGLGSSVNRRLPAVWRETDWVEVFPEIPIEVEAQAKLVLPGALERGPQIR